MGEQITVREVREDDHERWAELFVAYRDFYRLEPDAQVPETVWSWLGDEAHPVRGLVAEVDGRVVAILHHRPFARPSTGSVGTWVDDLYVDESARRGSVGRALADAVTEHARAEGHSVVRWITAEDNARARSLYDTMATATHWVVYDRAPVTG